jgi:hypothetical protein
MGGDSRVPIEYLHWHVPCWDWLTLCCPFAVSVVVQTPSSHVITYIVLSCAANGSFLKFVCVLMTLNVLKTHTADNTSSILDGSNAISIV